MAVNTNPLVGRWRIVEMELWDADVIDLLGPAFIELRRDNTGEFRFIAVEGHLDLRPSKAGAPRVDFSWDGNDEGDHATGRGWAEVSDDGALVGRIFFHMGDDSSFRAERSEHR
jgi:hypothetical protein